MCPGAGVEVSFRADGVGAGRVVAESRVIESKLHETGKGDRTPVMGFFNDQRFQWVVGHGGVSEDSDLIDTESGRLVG